MPAATTAGVPYAGLEQYLAHLYSTSQAGTRVWADAEGRATGRYFNSTLTSAFQPIRVLGTDRIAGYEGFARSYSETDQGQCLWKLLDHAANDDESVELDRLNRIAAVSGLPIHAQGFLWDLPNASIAATGRKEPVLAGQQEVPRRVGVA
jgi:EAL domain-containing protein (putative c-di-GMP-specific phosphodiesterase class I)